MKQEDKELLIKDLCARLPYGVKMNHIADDEHSPKTLIGVAKDMITLEGLGGYECVDVEDYKPYLFPLSSMSEEQKKELKDIIDQIVTLLTTRIRNKDYGIDQGKHHFDHTLELDWINKNHFDYRGLIEKGLALDATDKNIY
jgi:hypothetical protein